MPLLEHFKLCSETANVGSCDSPVESLTVLSVDCVSVEIAAHVSL